MTSVVLIRHAEPVMACETPAAERPLTEKGRSEASGLGTSLAGRCAPTIVWTSPQRRARETAALAFPLAEARVRRELSEVKKSWYASADEHANSAARYLRGDVVEGWECREDVLTRIAHLRRELGSLESLVLVSHGLLLTTWLDHEIGLDDPFSFWSSLRIPDAWELSLDTKYLVRIA
jgi:broad specificity phosphatase PhoE